MAKAKYTNCERTCEFCSGTFAFKENAKTKRRGEGRFCSRKCWDQSRTTPLVERFRRLCGPMTETGCIPWVGSKLLRGYGTIGIKVGTVKQNVLAHRVGYELAYGAIPEGMWVLHRCDNPSCVNAEHLFLGTHADNMDDMTAKGRKLIGAQRYNAKLTDDVVRSIRKRHADGTATPKQMALEYGVQSTAIKSVISGRTWKHVKHGSE